MIQSLRLPVSPVDERSRPRPGQPLTGQPQHPTVLRISLNGKPKGDEEANGRPPSLKTYVQRCYEGVFNDETKNAIEKEMKEGYYPPNNLIIDNNNKSPRWIPLDDRLGYNAPPQTPPTPYPDPTKFANQPLRRSKSFRHSTQDDPTQ
jgi:hypothetical protein